MSRFLVGTGVLCGLAGGASADVRFGDPYFIVSAEYAEAPVTFVGQFEPMIGTSIHVRDRNGLYGKIIAEAVIQPPSTRHTEGDPIYSFHYDQYGHEWRSTHFRYKPEFDTPEERDAQDARDAAWRIGSNWHTDLQVYVPQEGRSNARGALAGVSTSVFGSEKVELEVGFRWASIKADVCGTAGGPRQCTYRFLGMPVRLMIRVGRVGHVELGWDLNARALGDDHPDESIASPIHAGITLSPIERLFVRGGVNAAPRQIKDPGFAVEIGVRL